MITGEFMKQHYQVAKLVTKAVPAERVYLLGATVSQTSTASIFTNECPDATFISHCYLLVLINTIEANSCNGIQDKIENCCRSYLPVTAIVVGTQQYNEWLTTGHPFAMRVSKAAECLHDAGNVKHMQPSTEIDEHQQAKTREAHYMQGLNKTEEFVAGADLYRLRKQNKMAAFMLHQAAEQALHTLFRITTGLYVNTHSIDKLIRYCSMFSYKVATIFPRNNDKEAHIFQLLQKAYVDSRYKESYTINVENLLIITERIRAIESIVKETYSALLL